MPVDPKDMVVLNYSMLAGELYSVLEEKASWISHLFRDNPELGRDSDLIRIAGKFETLCVSLKLFNDEIERAGKNVDARNTN